MTSYSSSIVGLDQTSTDGTDRALYCATLRDGTLVKLKAGPSNPADPKATAVYHRNHHIGYLPARHHWVSRALGEGSKLRCTVTDVLLSEADKTRAEQVTLAIEVTHHANRERHADNDMVMSFTVEMAAAAAAPSAPGPSHRALKPRWFVLMGLALLLCVWIVQGLVTSGPAKTSPPHAAADALATPIAKWTAWPTNRPASTKIRGVFEGAH